MGMKVWNRCYHCSKPHADEATEPNWRLCSFCSARQTFLKLVLGASLTTIWALALANISKTLTARELIGLGGTTFSVLGGWYLAQSYLVILIRAASGLGGSPETFNDFSPKHFRSQFVGACLLILGFLIDGFIAVI